MRGRNIGVAECAGTGFGNVCRSIEGGESLAEGGEAGVELRGGERASLPVSSGRRDG